MATGRDVLISLLPFRLLSLLPLLVSTALLLFSSSRSTAAAATFRDAARGGGEFVLRMFPLEGKGAGAYATYSMYSAECNYTFRRPFSILELLYPR